MFFGLLEGPLKAPHSANAPWPLLKASEIVKTIPAAAATLNQHVAARA